MGGKMTMGGGAMPSPNAYYSPPSIEELVGALRKKLNMTQEDLDARSVGLTNIQRIGEDVIITAYAGGKFSTHVDKIDRFPSDLLVDKLRLLF